MRLRTSLEWLVDWYQAWQQGEKMQSFTLEQIAAYEQAPASVNLPNENELIRGSVQARHN
jgi:hypothetical protein